jgi:hypothetical protein
VSDHCGATIFVLVIAINPVASHAQGLEGSRLSTPNAFGGCERIELATYKAAPLQGARFFIVKGWITLGSCNPFFEHEHEDDFGLLRALKPPDIGLSWLRDNLLLLLIGPVVPISPIRKTEPTGAT